MNTQNGMLMVAKNALFWLNANIFSLVLFYVYKANNFSVVTQFTNGQTISSVVG